MGLGGSHETRWFHTSTQGRRKETSRKREQSLGSACRHCAPFHSRPRLHPCLGSSVPSSSLTLAPVLSWSLYIRLAHAKGDTRRVEDALAGLRDRAEQYEKDMQYELANVKQSRAAVEHDLAAAVSNLRDREEDLQYAAKRTEELEGYIASLRREVHARDEKLDQRHEEIERWTSECDRLRRQLDEARDRAIQNSSEHDRRIKEEKLLQQDMHARLSSAEVEKVGERLQAVVFFSIS